MYAREGTAHISPLKAIKGNIQINTLAIAGPDIRISRTTKDSPSNIQFIIDNLNKNKHSNNGSLRLTRINQFLLYDGKFKYDIHATTAKQGVLDINHIAIENFACNVSIKKLSKEQTDMTIRSVSGIEKSGFELKKLRAIARIIGDNLTLKDLEVKLPGSFFTSNILTYKPDTIPTHPAINGDLNCTKLSFDDIVPLFGPEITEFPDIAFNIKGYIKKNESYADITFNTTDNEISIHATSDIKSTYDATKRLSKLNIKELNISEKGFDIFEPFVDKGTIAKLKKLGNCNISLEAHAIKTQFSCKAKISSQAGDFKTSIFSGDKGHYAILAEGTGLKIGQITGIKELESCDFEARINSGTLKWGNSTEIGGQITGLTANSYRYAPIEFTTSIDKHRVKAQISTIDPNLSCTTTITYRPEAEERLDLNIKVDSINPHKLNLLNTPGDIYSFTAKCDYKDLHNGKSHTSMWINNFVVKNSNGTNNISNFHISDNIGEGHMLFVNSDFINFYVTGDFEYRSLHKSLSNIFTKHLYANNVHTHSTLGNNCIFKFNIKQSEVLSKMFNLPVTVNEPSWIEGEINDQNGTSRIKADINNISIANKIFRSIAIDCHSDTTNTLLEIQSSMPIIKKKDGFEYKNKENDILIGMKYIQEKDSIKSDIQWGGNQSNSTCGTLHISAAINPDNHEKPLIDATISSDNIVHNDSIWHLSAGSIKGDAGKIEIEKFKLYNDSQFISLDGCIGNSPKDTLLLNTANIELGMIFSFINFNALHFNGNITGSSTIIGALGSPDIKSSFNINDFALNNSPMGIAKASIGWDNNSESINLDVNIIGDSGNSRVNGILSQSNDTIGLNILANNLEMGFLNRYLNSFMSVTDGKGNGNVFLGGSWREIDFDGTLSLKCSTRIKATNAVYTLEEDTVRFTEGAIIFDNARLIDRNGNKGSMTGSVNHNHLSSWTCDLRFTTDNLLVYNTQSLDNMPFYGTVYTTGTARLTSNKEGLFLRANVSNGPNSRIIYNSEENGNARDNSFITFTDKRKRNQVRTGEQSRKYDKSNFLSRLNLEFGIDINDRMQLKAFTNIDSDDYISLYGNGHIQAVYDEHEGFTMKGNLDIERGTYKFTVQNIFPKEFSVIKGSMLRFNGNPFNAALDLKTRHLIPSASLSDLNPEVTRRKSVKVDCLMNIGGTLQSPVLSFDLALPEGSEEEREILASAINTPEQKNMQFIYLLGIGKFYTYDYSSTQSDNSHSSTAMESFISNTLSGQLNNMLERIIDNNNWDISGNFSTSEKGWNSMEVEGMLAGRLLNNRLLINGNFGYRENPIASSNFVGDFEIQWLMTPKGTVSLKAYSKTNDRYFSKTNLTTQGAGIILRHDFNNWRWWDKRKETDEEQHEKTAPATENKEKENDKEQKFYILE